MKKEFGKNLSISVVENICIGESLSFSTESDYLLISNKERVAELLSINEPTEGNIIDALISIHLVLEVGLNTLFRYISLASFKKNIDQVEIIKNLDNISFIDKVTLFVYNSKFNFTGLDVATNYHKIIGMLKDFSFIRNQILHGHSISTISDEGGERQSRLKKALNKKNLKEQVKKFLFIMEGMKFYFDCLDSNFTPSGKESLKREYLDDSFIPKNYRH